MIKFSLSTQKISTFVFLPLFFATQILTVDTAQAAGLSFASLSAEATAFQSWQPLPQHGSITEKIFAQHSRGTIVHIQDAHAVLDAQQNIQNLLDDLKSQFGVKDIYLEGGAGKLDPELHHIYPAGKKLSQDERETWMKEGDLTGAESFLMKTEKINGYGIEDVDSYWKNVEQYRAVDSQLEASNAFLKSFFERWQEAASRFLKPQLKKYLEVYAKSSLDASASADWFNAIQQYAQSEWKRDLSNIKEQIELPMLVRYYHLKKQTSELDFSKIELQKQDFFAVLKNLDHRQPTTDYRLKAETPRGLPEASPDVAQRGASSGSVLDAKQRGLTPMVSSTLGSVELDPILAEITVLIEKAKVHETHFDNPRETFEKLAAYLPDDFSMSKWPDLKRLIEQIILGSELDATALQKEAEQIHAQITSVIASPSVQLGINSTRQSLSSVIPAPDAARGQAPAGIQKHLKLDPRLRGDDKAEKLISMLEQYILLYKLLHLEMSREEFRRLQTSDYRLPPSSKEIKPVINGAIQFYQGAIAREEAFSENLNNFLSESRKKHNAVLVTGGFHAEMIREYAKAHQYSYVQIMPHISKITDEDRANYHRALLGKGSVPSSGVSEGHLRELGSVSHVAAALSTSAQIFVAHPKTSAETKHPKVGRLPRTSITTPSTTSRLMPRSEAREKSDFDEWRERVEAWVGLVLNNEELMRVLHKKFAGLLPDAPLLQKPHFSVQSRYSRMMDDGKRVGIPKEFRKQLNNEKQLAIKVDGVRLFVYPRSIIGKKGATPLSADLRFVEIDNSNRLAIPNDLVVLLAVQNREITITGAGDHFVIEATNRSEARSETMIGAGISRSEMRLAFPVPEKPVYWAINGAGATGGEALKANYISDDFIRTLYAGALNTRSEKAILRVINGVPPDKIKDFVERLKHHSTHGPFLVHGKPIEIQMGIDNEGEEFSGTHWIRINGDKKIYVLNERGGVQTIPWGKFKIHTVIESTGKYKNTEAAAGHLKRSVAEKFYTGTLSEEAMRRDDNGAERVIISTGFSGEMSNAPTIVMGSNHDELEKNAGHKITSNASCTTNCVAPLIQPFLEIFLGGLLMTVHAMTNSQDPRAALSNTSPASTGAAKNAGLIFRAVKGRLDGAALRVPIANVSLSEVTLVLKGRFTAQQINEMLRQAAENQLRGILDYRGSEDLISTKVMSSSASVVVQGNKTKAIVSDDGESTLVKLSGWYDNERGFSTRLIDHILYTAWVDEQVEKGHINLEGKKAELKGPKSPAESAPLNEIQPLGQPLEMPNIENPVRAAVSNGMTLSGKTLIRHVLLTEPKINIVAINGVKDIGNKDGEARKKVAQKFIKWLQLEDHSVKYRTEDARKKLRSFEIKQGDFVAGQLQEGEGNLTWLVFSGQNILLLDQGGDTKDLPWNFVKVDTVFETAKKRNKSDLDGHVSAGAHSVILVGSAKGVPVFQWGVNHSQKRTEASVMSTGVAEAGAMAPVLKILHEAFGAKRAMFTGAVTMSDGDTALDTNLTPATGVNIIPRESLAGTDVSTLIPGLAVEGSLNTVPNHDASAIVIQVELGRATTAAELNQYLKAASETTHQGVFTVTDDETVSSQFVDTDLPVIDLRQTIVAGGSLAQILIWSSSETFAKTASNLALYTATQNARSEARNLDEEASLGDPAVQQAMAHAARRKGRNEYKLHGGQRTHTPSTQPENVRLGKIAPKKSRSENRQLDKAIESVKKYKYGRSTADLMRKHRDGIGKISREVPLIEQIAETIYLEFGLKELSINKRLQFALAVFDKTKFKKINRFLEKLDRELLSDVGDSMIFLSNEQYEQIRKALSVAERELSVDENMLLRLALFKFAFDMPRQARRALELELRATELKKEINHPGSGKLPEIVFLTDYHGSSRTGSLIAFKLGVKDYQNVFTVEDLEKKIKDENIDLSKREILFVGGSDYVDRGPHPLWGFRFNQWLRKKGMLKFIPGNHEFWKNWNLLGLHLRPRDVLMQVLKNRAQNGRFQKEDIDLLMPFVATLEGDDEAEQTRRARKEMAKLLKQLWKAIQKRKGAPRDQIIETYADKIIDYGENANHSLEFWARDWFQHAQWADVFLDELNLEYINGLLAKLSAVMSGVSVADFSKLARKVSEQLGRPVRLEWDSEKAQWKFINEKFFDKDERVLAGKSEIKKLKKENEALRAAGKPQHRVPTLFPQTSKIAVEAVQEINQWLDSLNGKAKQAERGDTEKIITPQNYRSHPVVLESLTWDMQNTRLLYVDQLGNLYVHGIIPIKKDRTGQISFDVSYKGLQGIHAIQRMEYDIRRFFEQNKIQDAAIFREKTYKALGEAFQEINRWYSDKSGPNKKGILKPAAIRAFLAESALDSIGHDYPSIWTSRSAVGASSLSLVGHTNDAALQKNKIPYFVMVGRRVLVHADYEASEGGYKGLGAMISLFPRDEQGRTMAGFQRMGYRETVDSLGKEIAVVKKELQAADLEEGDRENLNKKLEALEDRLALRKSLGHQIENLTEFDEHLTPAAREKLNVIQTSKGLAQAYLDDFSAQLVALYTDLIKGAEDRGLDGKALHYRQRLDWVKEEFAVRSEMREGTTEGTKRFLNAAHALKAGDATKFNQERKALEKLGMKIVVVGNSKFFSKKWKGAKPRVYSRDDREEIIRLASVNVPQELLPKEREQFRVTIESQILAIGKNEVGLIGVKNYDAGQSKEFPSGHLMVISASPGSGAGNADSLMRQTASGFMNATSYGGEKGLNYQVQYLWWVGREAFHQMEEELHGGSFSKVFRRYRPDGSSYVVKTADPRKDGGKLLNEARMIQAMSPDVAVYFPKI